MKKGLIAEQLEKLAKLSTIELSAHEDLKYHRFIKKLMEEGTKYEKEKQELVDTNKDKGLTFKEDGSLDREGSNEEVVKRVEEQITIMMNEEIDMKILPAEILNKIKKENMEIFKADPPLFFELMENYLEKGK